MPSQLHGVVLHLPDHEGLASLRHIRKWRGRWTVPPGERAALCARCQEATPSPSSGRERPTAHEVVERLVIDVVEAARGKIRPDLTSSSMSSSWCWLKTAFRVAISVTSVGSMRQLAEAGPACGDPLVGRCHSVPARRPSRWQAETARP